VTRRRHTTPHFTDGDEIEDGMKAIANHRFSRSFDDYHCHYNHHFTKVMTTFFFSISFYKAPRKYQTQNTRGARQQHFIH
jgi:hypothetical protein